MELYFIRHGQSTNNANWGAPGFIEDSDAELTDLGRQQAQLAAEFLRQNQPRHAEGWDPQNRNGFGLTHLYTSLFTRAVNTAAPIARALEIPFTAWPEIHEVGGVFSREDKDNPLGLPGKPRSFYEQNFPELTLPDWLDESGWWNKRPFETFEQRQARADTFLTDLLARHGDHEDRPTSRVAIVSHGEFFIHLVCSVLEISSKHRASQYWLLLNNCSISRFDLHKGGKVITYMNNTQHLPGHLIT